jgi:general secretion pathway protein I
MNRKIFFINKHSCGRKSRGFTLIEIMVALAIFAVVSAALIRNASMSVRQTAIVTERTLAWWVGENQLSEMRSVSRDPENYPPIGNKTLSVRMAQIDWEIQVDVKSTQNENMRRVEISVFSDDDLDVPLANIHGFLGKY